MIRWITALLVLVALTLGGVLAYQRFAVPLGGTEVTTRAVVPDAPLVGDDGRPHRLSDWSGRTRVVFFGFTRCPDVCPTTMGVLARAYEQLTPAQQEQLKIALITVDPEFDTPEQLRDYLGRFHADFSGFTGEEEHLKAMQKGFYAYGVQTKNGQVMHSDAVVVVDGEGRMRRVYTQNDVATGALSRDLKRLAGGRF